ncbi:hypothetical protein [Floccifex sp.]|uniref:hypothetical protein n=1 Tax=Floccifex sp. TaxID=2815810 RepID=UPI002A7574A1|nr:hypothetical protein [Floccifex sp.]MDD7280665.1 hypothetical protein [Erysipelotrichaceae bacterium]MDY2958264.1 hypothetical protein [Floccifex sp.]
MNYDTIKIDKTDDTFEINNIIYSKADIQSIKQLNIEAQFINDDHECQHIVLDQFAQTGIFTNPKFYIVLIIKINNCDYKIMISKKPVYYGSNQYISDKKEVEDIIKKLKE